jgi:hypothetical protein
MIDYQDGGFFEPVKPQSNYALYISLKESVVIDACPLAGGVRVP